MRKKGSYALAVAIAAALLIGVGLALPKSDRALAVGSDDTSTAADGRPNADEHFNNGRNPNAWPIECLDETGTPLPTVSNPCMAKPNSNRAQALTNEAMESRKMQLSASCNPSAEKKDIEIYEACWMLDETRREIAELNDAEIPLDVPRLRTVTESSGHKFSVRKNAHGAILVSSDAVLYLGVDCDVRSPQYGHGSWNWANGGFRIEFDGGQEFGFLRQDPPVHTSDCLA